MTNDTYLAILIADGFIISRPIGKGLRDNPMFLADHMARQGEIHRNNIDTILVVENGGEGPNVVHHYDPNCWSDDE